MWDGAAIQKIDASAGCATADRVPAAQQQFTSSSATTRSSRRRSAAAACFGVRWSGERAAAVLLPAGHRAGPMAWRSRESQRPGPPPRPSARASSRSAPADPALGGAALLGRRPLLGAGRRPSCRGPHRGRAPAVPRSEAPPSRRGRRRLNGPPTFGLAPPPGIDGSRVSKALQWTNDGELPYAESPPKQGKQISPSKLEGAAGTRPPLRSSWQTIGGGLSPPVKEDKKNASNLKFGGPEDVQPLANDAVHGPGETDLRYGAPWMGSEAMTRSSVEFRDPASFSHGELVEQAQQNLIMAQSQKPALFAKNEKGELVDALKTSIEITDEPRHYEFRRPRGEGIVPSSTKIEITDAPAPAAPEGFILGANGMLRQAPTGVSAGIKKGQVETPRMRNALTWDPIAARRTREADEAAARCATAARATVGKELFGYNGARHAPSAPMLPMNQPMGSAAGRTDRANRQADDQRARPCAGAGLGMLVERRRARADRRRRRRGLRGPIVLCIRARRRPPRRRRRRHRARAGGGASFYGGDTQRAGGDPGDGGDAAVAARHMRTFGGRRDAEAQEPMAWSRGCRRRLAARRRPRPRRRRTARLCGPRHHPSDVRAMMNARGHPTGLDPAGAGAAAAGRRRSRRTRSGRASPRWRPVAARPRRRRPLLARDGAARWRLRLRGAAAGRPLLRRARLGATHATARRRPAQAAGRRRRRPPRRRRAIPNRLPGGRPREGNSSMLWATSAQQIGPSAARGAAPIPKAPSEEAAREKAKRSSAFTKNVPPAKGQGGGFVFGKGGGW